MKLFAPETAAIRTLGLRLVGSLDLHLSAETQEAAPTDRDIPFDQFVREAWPIIEPATAYQHNWHIDAVCAYLERVDVGEITRSVINMPPRHMKSILVSVLWPCWRWTRSPGLRFIFASYSHKLSIKHSIDRRTVIESGWYQQHWGHKVTLRRDFNRQDEFVNTARGHMIASSVGGSLTGKGANIIVVDDPHDPERAHSDAERQTALRWFDQTLSTRLDSDQGVIVVMMQRLHQKDISGHAIDDLGYDAFVLPAIARKAEIIDLGHKGQIRRPKGNVLWPARWGKAYLASQEIVLGANAYAGQYQQTPTAKKGSMFDESGFKTWLGPAPGSTAYESRVLARVRMWDSAGTEDGGDWTVGARMALLDDHTFVLEDIRRGQWDPHGVEAAVLDTAKSDQWTGSVPCAVREEQEPGSSGKAVWMIRSRKLPGVDYLGEPTTKDKVTRAKPFSAAVRGGNVYVVTAPWNREYFEEMRMFPRGAHDDQVDASAGGYNYLALQAQMYPVSTRVRA